MSIAPARTTNLRKDWSKHLFILFFILIELFPLYMMFQVSFKDNATFIRQPWLPINPASWHWENWAFAFHLILPYIANTVLAMYGRMSLNAKAQFSQCHDRGLVGSHGWRMKVALSLKLTWNIM